MSREPLGRFMRGERTIDPAASKSVGAAGTSLGRVGTLLCANRPRFRTIREPLGQLKTRLEQLERCFVRTSRKIAQFCVSGPRIVLCGGHSEVELCESRALLCESGAEKLLRGSRKRLSGFFRTKQPSVRTKVPSGCSFYGLGRCIRLSGRWLRGRELSVRTSGQACPEHRSNDLHPRTARRHRAVAGPGLRWVVVPNREAFRGARSQPHRIR